MAHCPPPRWNSLGFHRAGRRLHFHTFIWEVRKEKDPSNCACPACPVGQNDRTGVGRNYRTGVGLWLNWNCWVYRYCNPKPPTGQGLTSIVRVSVVELPAASLAVTVMALSSPQWRVIPEIVQSVVPEAVPLPPRLFTQVTLVMATSSEAVPPRSMVSSSVE